MTIPIANVANTNTFLFWQSITNQCAWAINTAVVTTTANGSSAQTPGNASISGTFSANIHLSNTLVVNTSGYFGNSTVNVAINATAISIANSTANINIPCPTSVQATGNQYFLNANSTWAIPIPAFLATNSITTTGTSAQNVDSWSMTTYRSAEYQVNVNDNNANNHFASKLLVTHDTASGYITEWAQLTTNSAVGTFSITSGSGNVTVQFTPVSTNTTVRYSRIII